MLYNLLSCCCDEVESEDLHSVGYSMLLLGVVPPEPVGKADVMQESTFVNQY